MSDFEETPQKNNSSPLLSESELSLLSVAEIDQRIEMLESEINRLKSERQKKGSSRAAAEALFR